MINTQLTEDKRREVSRLKRIISTATGKIEFWYLTRNRDKAIECYREGLKAVNSRWQMLEFFPDILKYHKKLNTALSDFEAGYRGCPRGMGFGKEI